MMLNSRNLRLKAWGMGISENDASRSKRKVETISIQTHIILLENHFSSPLEDINKYYNMDIF